ncbi:MAG: cell division protein FtsL [Oscillospiraceae bacterium]|jgi:cell division protein FtsL|nr:cell division protein FtsL [Oscillospiraceae bacterium]
MTDENGLTKIPVFGSLAYDLETAAQREWFEPEKKQKIVIPEAPPIEREQLLPKAKPRPKQSVSAMAIIGYACAAVFIILYLTASAQLTVITDEAAKLETQLQELESERNRLLIEYESVFNRSEIEEYATSVLGMRQPRPEQIRYINSSAPDKAVILEEDSGSDGFLDSLSNLLTSITSYFG